MQCRQWPPREGVTHDDNIICLLAGHAELEAAVRDAGRKERQLLEKRLEQLQEELDQERQLNGQQLRCCACILKLMFP